MSSPNQNLSSGDDLPPDTRSPDDIASARGTRFANRRLYVAPGKPRKEWGKRVWIIFAIFAVLLTTSIIVQLKMVGDARDRQVSPSNAAPSAAKSG